MSSSPAAHVSDAGREAIAVHEAGHTAMAYRFGPVGQVSIVPEGERLGGVWYSPPTLTGWSERTSSGLRTRVRALPGDANLLIVLAGEEAETMFTGERNEGHASRDREAAQKLVERLSIGELGLRPTEWPRLGWRRGTYLTSKRGTARHFLRQHESHVLAFAEELLRVEVMSAAAVEAFLGARSIADARIAPLPSPA